MSRGRRSRPGRNWSGAPPEAEVGAVAERDGGARDAAEGEERSERIGADRGRGGGGAGSAVRGSGGVLLFCRDRAAHDRDLR